MTQKRYKSSIFSFRGRKADSLRSRDVNERIFCSLLAKNLNFTIGCAFFSIHSNNYCKSCFWDNDIFIIQRAKRVCLSFFLFQQRDFSFRLWVGAADNATRQRNRFAQHLAINFYLWERLTSVFCLQCQILLIAKSSLSQPVTPENLH